MLSEGFLTEYDYLNFEFFDANIFQTKGGLGLEVTANICQSEIKKIIDLRSGPKQVSQIPKKKTIPHPKQSSSQAQKKKTESG